MPRLRRAGRLALVLPALCLAAAPPAGFAQTAPKAVLVRPTGPHLTREMLQVFASAGPGVTLSREQYPEAGVFTPRQVIQVICGQVSPEFLKLVTAQNGLAPADLDRVANEAIYKLHIPSCPYVAKFTAPKTYTVRPGDTFATIKEQFTGAQGGVATTARFFNVAPNVIRSGKLGVGQQLKIPYATAATVLPEASAEMLVAAIKPPPGKVTADFLTQEPAPEGRIVTYVGAGGVNAEPVTPKECGVAAVRPFDPDAVSAAFAWALQRARDLNQIAPNRTDVMVADNGFFGATPRANGGYDFREPEFGARYFDTSGYDKHLGPTIGNAPGPITYPVNFQNGLAPTGALSGHGTHVTGLVLGGAGFLAKRTDVFEPGGVRWLKVLEINLGRGSDVLLPGSQKELADKLLLLSGTRIVNMSISFNGKAAGVPEAFQFLDDASGIVGVGRHLFVVAAGNDLGANVAAYQPAARGGLGVAGSVITVAALAPDGKLAPFSNIGSTGVDVAAPGCNLASWTAFTGGPVLLSGTSQAAPIVSFEAALIRGLTGAGPPEIKARVVASGDLLAPDDQRRVSSHLSINIPRALYVFDDYVRWGPKGAERTVLGRVVKAAGIACSDDGLSVDLAELAAFKRDDTHAFAYRRPANAKRLAVCEANASGVGDVVVVEPQFEVAGGYPESPEHKAGAPSRQVTIPVAQVTDIVMRMIDAN